MVEYEKGLKVDDINPFINYCKENGYSFVSTTVQNRKVFENMHNKNIIARITKNESGGQTEIIFDCKNFDKKDVDFTVSKESEEMILNEESEKAIMSILQTINFKLVADNFRTRHVYKKDNIKFEIDNYTSPCMNVVAIEGEQQLVDSVYNDIQQKLGKHDITFKE